MHPAVLDAERDTPRPAPWLDDFSGVSRRDAVRELLARHAEDERQAGQPGTWARVWTRVRATWRAQREDAR